MTPHRVFLSALAAIATLLLGCEKSTEPQNPRIVSYQVPGCQAQLGKLASSDSCFSYQFHQALVVEFCMVANCCPDSNRFRLRSNVGNDTIFVSVSDTAPPLCNCLCPYVLHFEFYDLPRDSYTFFCTREDYSSRLVFYSARVNRN
jgi:hypothetical protein